MEPNELRRSRRDGRRIRKTPISVEVQALEQRQVLSWTPLGFSLPDLTISAYSAPVAAYGQEIAVTVRVQNLGASSILEPLALEPGAISTADAPPSTVGVWLSRSPHFGRGAIQIGEIEVPAIAQNSFVEITDTVTMPQQLPFLPGTGGTVYLYFRADSNNQVIDLDRTNNQTRRGVPVEIEPPLPELVGLSIDVPTVMQPGDAIAPTIKIANYGTTNPNQQSSFQVALVASTDPFFGPGDQVLQTYTVLSLPPLSLVPMDRTILRDVNVDDPINVLTIQATEPVILPSAPAQYFLGVVVDPDNVIQEISEIGRGPDPAIKPIRPVGPPIVGLPPAGVVEDPLAEPNAVFPFTPYRSGGRLPTLYENIFDPPIIVEPASTIAAVNAIRSAANNLRIRIDQVATTEPATGPSRTTPRPVSFAAKKILFGLR